MTSQPHGSLPRAHHRAFGLLDVKLVCVRLQATAPCRRAQRQGGAPARLPAAALRQALVFASGLQPTEAPSTRSTCAGVAARLRQQRVPTVERLAGGFASNLCQRSEQREDGGGRKSRSGLTQSDAIGDKREAICRPLGDKRLGWVPSFGGLLMGRLGPLHQICSWAMENYTGCMGGVGPRLGPWP